MPTSPDQPPSGPAPTSKTAEEIVVLGTIEVGVEPGCVILRADGGTSYQLLGTTGAQDHQGSRVRVRGRLQPGILTTCMQGTPLQVLSIQPA